MRRGAFAVLFVLAAAGCAESPSLQEEQLAVREGPLPVTRLTLGLEPLTISSGMTDSARLVVRDQETWRQVWNELWPEPYRRPLPTVSFSREMMVVVAMGLRPTSGYYIYVEGAYQRADHVEVMIRKVSPGQRCVIDNAATAPADAVRLPASTQPVRLREQQVVVQC